MDGILLKTSGLQDDGFNKRWVRLGMCHSLLLYTLSNCSIGSPSALDSSSLGAQCVMRLPYKFGLRCLSVLHYNETSFSPCNKASE